MKILQQLLYDLKIIPHCNHEFRNVKLHENLTKVKCCHCGLPITEMIIKDLEEMRI